MIEGGYRPRYFLSGSRVGIAREQRLDSGRCFWHVRNPPKRPPLQRFQILPAQLSLTLNATISQRLVPGIKGGLCVALEIMILNPSIRNLIRENKLHQIYGMMQIGQDKSGMITLNQSLLGLVIKRKVDVRTAFMFSSDPEELDKMLKTAGV